MYEVRGKHVNSQAILYTTYLEALLVPSLLTADVLEYLWCILHIFMRHRSALGGLGGQPGAAKALKKSVCSETYDPILYLTHSLSGLIFTIYIPILS